MVHANIILHCTTPTHSERCIVAVGTHYSDVQWASWRLKINGHSTVCSIDVSDWQQSKHHSSVLCAGNPPVTNWLPARKASNAETACMSWRHYGNACMCAFAHHIELAQIVIVFCFVVVYDPSLGHFCALFTHITQGYCTASGFL